MSNLNDQTIIITATVGPLKNGKRAVLVSAAPEGELPVVEMGNFAELKTLFDTVWLALLKRAPMVVPDKARKGEPEKTKKAAAKPDTADDDETENVETLDEDNTADETENTPPPEPEPESEPDQLVRIENDPTAPVQTTLF